MSAMKKVLIGAGALLGLVVVGGGAFVWTKISAFDESMRKKYDVALVPFERSTDPAVLARGQHLVESVMACSNADCHGKGLAGGKTTSMGPLGTFTAPNASPGGVLLAYDDAELARMLSHGLRKDGTSLRFMPAQDWSWLPASDIQAVVSYLRTLPSDSKPNGPIQLGTLAKVLDRQDMIVIDVARRIDHANVGKAPPPSPTAEYGKFLSLLCTGCHGANLSGGPIPGAPSDLPTPSNLTPHASGLAGWTFEDFDKLLTQQIRKNGQKVDPFMPTESFGKMNETEKRALFSYLTTLPARELGGR